MKAGGKIPTVLMIEDKNGQLKFSIRTGENLWWFTHHRGVISTPYF